MSIQDNVWSEGSADPAPSATGTEAGSDVLPSPVDLLMETGRDLLDNFVGYLLAGLGIMAVLLPVTLVLFGGGTVLGFLPFLLTGDEDMIGLSILILYGVVLASIPVIVVVSMPLVASLERAGWHHLVDGEELGFGSSFSRMWPDLGKVLLAQLAVTFLAFVGVFFCYVGALAVAIATVFTLSAVVVHGLGVVDALKLSVNHFRKNPLWYLAFWGLGFVVLMVAAYIPFIGNVIGPVFYYMYVLRAYRHIFGDGEAPRVLAVA